AVPAPESARPAGRPAPNAAPQPNPPPQPNVVTAPTVAPPGRAAVPPPPSADDDRGRRRGERGNNESRGNENRAERPVIRPQEPRGPETQRVRPVESAHPREAQIGGR